ncbi:MAG: GGDEF domain-containing protein [Hyphomonas oceanitis]|uniref:GGDEF domain-containing protein n=1 Tax=Hyphomonas oceanitis TaxID=81033 RepID=UPI0030025E4C
MRLSEHEWKAARTIVSVTLIATAISFVSIWTWAHIDPVITLRRCYEAAIVMPLLIAPLCSFGVQRAHLKVRKLSDQNEHLANHDELTGLSNRRAFFARAEAMQSRMGAVSSVFACAIADIDDFKRINDQHGHDAGDRVLKCMSDILAGIAPPDVVIARLGGEEFAIAGHFTSEGIARFWFDALVREIASCQPAGHDVTVSLGWCVAQGGESLSTLLNRADRALYASKAAGKNQAGKGEREPLRVVAIA